MQQRYDMYLQNASGNTKCGVVFLDTACILSGMKWYEKAKRIMADKGIIQKDLLTVFGVSSRGAVGHYLTGRRQPDPKQMRALAERLGCSLDDLLNNEEIDPLQLQIHKVIRAAEKAMSTSTHKFTDAERMSVYRAAFAAGLDMEVSDEQLTAYLSGFIKK